MFSNDFNLGLGLFDRGDMPETRALIHIVAGPTASGKSAKALALAQALDGVIINCDSLQIYDALPLLTAQPSAQEQKATQHRLYSVLHPNAVCSAGNWREMVIPEIEGVLAAGKVPIVCGGTGLYIKTLIEGLSPMPDVPDAIRAEAVDLQKNLGNPAFYAALQACDPVMAERLHPFHTARLVRAYEVMAATGKSLAAWQDIPREGPPAHWHFEIHKIMPEREESKSRCDARFEWMLENGALDEVEALDRRLVAGEVHENVPVTKALGFKPLRAYLRGEMSRAEAVERAKVETRRYAKRQVTWFRHQL
ncbi:MAG: tRNA (adenosine(37)-N6)-dimethylallyltransferase MiaA [Alphaproteobacteria bacterium]|nr:tRNA (adenosine(37)-N6)-dimethylallyltransferase MiaA [Alphaproteobacteria bacterium]